MALEISPVGQEVKITLINGHVYVNGQLAASGCATTSEIGTAITEWLNKHHYYAKRSILTY